jgi:hypothetical protein
MVRSPIPLSHGDRIAEESRITAHDGRLSSTNDVPLVAWPRTMLRALHEVLKDECGPAASSILREGGRAWGRSLAERITQGATLDELPTADIQASLSSLFAQAGWGRVEIDFGRFSEGLIEITATNGPSSAWGESATPAADQLLGGVLAGLFSELCAADLDCLQTDYEIVGSAPARFIIGLPARLTQVAELARQGQPHARVVAALESIRV